MKLSKKTDYALRTVLELSSHGTGAQLTVGDIAARQEIPVSFLEQILLTLKKAGIVTSRRGKNGGYLLSRPADQISLADVVRLTDGSLAPAECTSDCSRDACSRRGMCPIHEVWEEIHQYISRTLEGLTMQQMCRRAREMQAAATIDYVI